MMVQPYDNEEGIEKQGLLPALALGAMALYGVLSGGSKVAQGIKKRDWGKVLGGGLEMGLSVVPIGGLGSIIGKGAGRVVGSLGSKAIGRAFGQEAAKSVGSRLAAVGGKSLWGGTVAGQMADIGGGMLGFSAADYLSGGSGTFEPVPGEQPVFGGAMAGMGAPVGPGAGQSTGGSSMGQNESQYGALPDTSKWSQQQPVPFNFSPLGEYQRRIAAQQQGA
jgi:hypothetical protein